MPASDETYTYRNGKQLRLRKRGDQFVVRAAPDRVARLRMGEARRVSSASSRVTVARDRLEDAMTRSRLIAPTHHAYEIADNGEEFLITDRILVRFERDLSSSELDEFVGRYALVLLDTYSERDYLFQLTDHTGMNPVKLIVLLTEDEPLVETAASKDLTLDGYARTPPASFDPDTSWDVSPVAPFDRGDFRDISSTDGSWSPWFGHGRVDAPAAVTEAGGGAVAGESLHVEVAPNATVPDDDPAGITSSLQVDRAGRIERAVLTLNVEHSWIGDLRVQLSAPDGTAVVVHDRQGSGSDNISQSFDSASFPRLAALVGRMAQGRWTLSVSDLAQADEGVLKRWSLDLTLGAASLAREDVSSVPVPDDDSSGVSRLLEFPAGSVIADMSVAVDITHPFVGDLLVALTAPNNSVINLHDRSGGNADNIIRTWRMSELAGLRALQGLDAGGTWKLRVADLERRDAGKLNRWRIEVTS